MYKTTNKKRRSKNGKEVKMIGGMSELVERFIAEQRSFILSSTSRTKKLVTEFGNVYFEDKELKKFKFFSLVNQLKNKILDKKDLLIKYREENFISPYSVAYFDFNKTLKNYIIDSGSTYTVENCIEIDIVKAYYNALLILGFIDLDFYNKCISIPKADRLRLVGSIATVKTVKEFTDGELVNEFVEQNSDLRDVWWLICMRVSNAMQVLTATIKQLDVLHNKKESSFLFYWVDGLYLRELTKEEQFKHEGTVDLYNDICNELKEQLGFDFKLTRLNKIELLNTGKTLEMKVFKSERENDYKLFFIPDYNLKAYFL